MCVCGGGGGGYSGGYCSMNLEFGADDKFRNCYLFKGLK